MTVIKQTLLLSEVSSLASEAQIGEGLFHQVVSQKANANFDLRRRHPLFCQMMCFLQHFFDDDALLVT
jgi:hypothetical protein